MADELTISIRGIEEVQAALSTAPARIVKNAFAKALAAGAVPVVRELSARTPKDTGDLQAHLMTDIAVNSQGKGGVAQIGYGREGWKARLVEYGHRMLGHKPQKKDMGAVIAHPFMRPAADASADDSIAAFAESLSESLKVGF